MKSKLTHTHTHTHNVIQVKEKKKQTKMKERKKEKCIHICIINGYSIYPLHPSEYDLKRDEE